MTPRVVVNVEHLDDPDLLAAALSECLERIIRQRRLRK